MARWEGPSTATIFRIVFTVAAAGLVLYATYLVREVLLLVLIAGFLAVGLDPAVAKLESWGLRRGHAVAVLAVTTLAALVGFLAAVVPALVRQVTEFATNLPDYVERIAESNPRIEEFVNDRDLGERLRQATTQLPSGIGGSLGAVLGIAGSVIASIFSAVTVIVLTIYFSLGLSRIRAGTMKLIPRSRRKRSQDLIDQILEKIGGYIAGNVIVSLIAGTLTFVFLLIAGVPFALALALWVAIADLIPLVGATLGAIPAVVVAFFASPGQGIAALVFFFVYQQAENYLIAPRVMKQAVDVSPAAVLLAALIGASLLGAAGALMAIPAAASMKLLAEELVFPASDRT